MTGSEYQVLAMRTNDGKNRGRLLEVLDFDSIDVAGVLDGCMGMAGETGELVDLCKKWVFHRAPLAVEHAKKELGDVLWYAAMICHSFGWSLDEIMRMNIAKLRERYPEGFDTEHANHRKEGDV